jgi:hypothetical protein
MSIAAQPEGAFDFRLGPDHSMLRVNKLAKGVAVLLLAVWGLATMHCALEQLPGFSLLRCCEHLEAAPHQDADCQQDACAVVESGRYRMDDPQAFVPIPFRVLSYLLPQLEPPMLRIRHGLPGPSGSSFPARPFHLGLPPLSPEVP